MTDVRLALTLIVGLLLAHQMIRAGRMVCCAKIGPDWALNFYAGDIVYIIFNLDVFEKVHTSDCGLFDDEG